MSATPVDRVQALMAKFEDLAVEAGKSAIAIFENIDGGSPEAIALKQGYNRAFTALESALRSELAGKDAERLDYLQPADLGDLMRFEETASDDESYDIGKTAVKRLASLGVLENHGFGRYSITAFGHFALEHMMFEQRPKLPLMTNSDRDEMYRAAIQQTKEST